jgi:hypothetical protein
VNADVPKPGSREGWPDKEAIEEHLQWAQNRAFDVDGDGSGIDPLMFTEIRRMALSALDGQTPTIRTDNGAVIKRLEDEIAEQCRLNGMGAQREAALLGKVSRLEDRVRALEGALRQQLQLVHEITGADEWPGKLQAVAALAPTEPQED